MSIVCCRVGKNSIEIASDSITVLGYTQTKGQNTNHTKLFQVNGITIGSAGLASECGLLKIFCMTHAPKDGTEDSILNFMSEFAEWKYKKTDTYSLENHYIIIFQKVAFQVGGFFISQITSFTAIGAGRDYALSVLHNEGTVEDAVKTACELSIYCEEPVKLLSI